MGITSILELSVGGGISKSEGTATSIDDTVDSVINSIKIRFFFIITTNS